MYNNVCINDVDIVGDERWRVITLTMDNHYHRNYTTDKRIPDSAGRWERCCPPPCPRSRRPWPCCRRPRTSLWRWPRWGGPLARSPGCLCSAVLFCSAIFFSMLVAILSPPLSAFRSHERLEVGRHGGGHVAVQRLVGRPLAQGDHPEGRQGDRDRGWCGSWPELGLDGLLSLDDRSLLEADQAGTLALAHCAKNWKEWNDLHKLVAKRKK